MNFFIKSNTRISTVLTVLAVSIFFCARADAIPHFARKYEMSCENCHWQQPKLNSFGKWFAANGYRLSDDEEPSTKIGGAGTWPISVKVEMWAQAKNTAAASSDFQLHSIELQSAGSLPGGASFFIEKYLEERGAFAGAGDVALRLPLGKRAYLQAGQFTALTHIPDTGRITITRNMVYNARASIGGKTNTVRLRDRQRGIELGIGNSEGTSNLSISVFNGNGAGAETAEVSDNNDTKSVAVNGYTKVSKRLRAGGFAHVGNTAAPTADDNSFYRAGITAIASPSEKWNIEFILATGRDKNLFDDKGATGTRIGAVSLEADYLIKPGRAVFYRYGQWRTTATGRARLKSTEWTLGYSHMIQDNVKWTSEYQTIPGKGNDTLLMELELNL